ncbi:hypothetical protein VCHC50A2_1739B, partial [Vibrio cholerae HC-50A2]
IIAH